MENIYQIKYNWTGPLVIDAIVLFLEMQFFKAVLKNSGKVKGIINCLLNL